MALNRRERRAGLRLARLTTLPDARYFLKSPLAALTEPLVWDQEPDRSLVANERGTSLYTESGNVLVAEGTAYTLAADTASFALTGNATALKVARKLAAAQQTYALTGTTTGLKAGRKLAAAQQTYSMTGNDATLTYAGAAVTRRIFVLT